MLQYFYTLNSPPQSWQRPNLLYKLLSFDDDDDDDDDEDHVDAERTCQSLSACVVFHILC